MTVSKIIAQCILLVDSGQGTSEPHSLTANAHEDSTFTCTIDGKQQMYQGVPQILQAWNESQTRKFLVESTETASGRHPLGRAQTSQARASQSRED